MLKPHHEERLLKTASVLMNLPKERKANPSLPTAFNISWWIDNENDEEELNCGTAACAVGHVMFHPWFKQRGLRPSESEYARGIVVPTFDNKKGGVKLESWDAVEAFYGITDDEADYLFSGTRYDYDYMSEISPKTVALRIRQFVKDKRKEMAR